MKTTKSEELYLKTILKLSKEQEKVKCADIARVLGYSRPSTLGLVNKLEAKNYLYRDAKKSIFLTPEGIMIANVINNRHEVLKKAFMGLGANESLAEKEAKNMENYISDEMLEIIDNHITLHLNQLHEKNISLDDFESFMKQMGKR